MVSLTLLHVFAFFYEASQFFITQYKEKSLKLNAKWNV